MVSDVNLGKFSVVTMSNISSVPFSFPSDILCHYTDVTPFIVVTQSLDSLCFCFSVLEVSIEIFCSSEVLSTVCPV